MLHISSMQVEVLQNFFAMVCPLLLLNGINGVYFSVMSAMCLLMIQSAPTQSTKMDCCQKCLLLLTMCTPSTQLSLVSVLF